MINYQQHSQDPSPHHLLIPTKVRQLQNQIRSRQVQQYRQKIRLQRQAFNTLSTLLDKIPQQLQCVLSWCQQMLEQFSKFPNLQFPTYKVIELFKLVQKYPCLQTIQLLHLMSHKIVISGINQLFQYDIIGFLHRIISFPEKITTRTLDPQINLNFVRIDLVKDCIMTIATLCEKSSAARNFIVTNHKSFLCIKKAQQKFGDYIKSQWIAVLCSFVKHPIEYDDQFVRITKKIIEVYCLDKQNCLSIEEIRMLTKSLTNIVKTQEKWAIDLIQSTVQYDILETILGYYSEIRKRINDNNIKFNEKATKGLGLLYHDLNMFIIFYLQISTNQYFIWQAFLDEWFFILNQSDFSVFLYFDQPRQDIFFVISNNLTDGEDNSSFFKMVEALVCRYSCFSVFAKILERETCREAIQELARAIGSLFNCPGIQKFYESLLNSYLLQNMIETILHKNLLLKGTDSIQLLLIGLRNLIQQSRDEEFYHKLVYLVQGYQQQILNFGNLAELEEAQLVDQLLKSVQYQR